jgi:hypothetical protein
MDCDVPPMDRYGNGAIRHAANGTTSTATGITSRGSAPHDLREPFTESRMMTAGKIVAVMLTACVALMLSHPATLAQATDRHAVRRFANVVDLTHALDEYTPFIPVPGITFPFKKRRLPRSPRMASRPIDGKSTNTWERRSTRQPISSKEGVRWIRCRSTVWWFRWLSSTYLLGPRPIRILR